MNTYCIIGEDRENEKKQNIVKTKRIIASLRGLGESGGLGLCGLFMLLLLAACSGEQIEGPAQEPTTEPVEEPEPESAEEGIPLYLRGYVSPYTEVAGAMTRAFSLAGYVEPTEYVPIGAFFTNDARETKVEQRRILHNKNKEDDSDEWYYTPPVPIATDNYQLYGYMPYNAAKVTIEPNPTYAEGATLHFSGMNIITTKDICVMVGAKHGTDADSPVEDEEGKILLKTGNFDCSMNYAVGGDGAANYLFLLFDHLYASISFRFRVDETYAKLRTIHLKKLQLTAHYNDTYNAPKKKEMEATVVLRKTSDGSSPIQSFTVTETEGSDYVGMEKIFEGDIELTSDHWSESIAYVPYSNAYVPPTSTYYVLRSTYDVYDRKGNLIRLNNVAENKLDPFHIFNVHEIQRGKQYVLKLIINPTYLYQLSDPDLDNPTLVIE